VERWIPYYLQHTPPQFEERIRFIMHGTPLNFAAVAESLRSPESPELHFRFIFQKAAERAIGILFTPSSDRIVYGDGKVVMLEQYRADFEAILLPDNKTLVKVLSNDKSWVHIELIWQALAAELEQLGFLLSPNATELAEPGPEQVARRDQSAEERTPGKQAAVMDVYFLRGTLAQFKAELELSGIAYQIWTEKPAYLVVRIGNFLPVLIQARVKGRGGGPRIRTPQGRVTSVWMPQGKSKRETAKGIITAVEQDGGVLRLEVDLENDPARPGYSKVHQRWATLRSQLGERLDERTPGDDFFVIRDEYWTNEIKRVPADTAAVERLLRLVVTAPQDAVSSSLWGEGCVVIHGAGESMLVRLRETSWLGTNIRPDKEGRYLSVSVVDNTEGHGHRRLMDIQIYPLSENLTWVVFRRFSNGAIDPPRRLSCAAPCLSSGWPAWPSYCSSCSCSRPRAGRRPDPSPPPPPAA
jgi:hypothetical protein